jgi:hypothetical protein
MPVPQQLIKSLAEQNVVTTQLIIHTCVTMACGDSEFSLPPWSSRESLND